MSTRSQNIRRLSAVLGSLSVALGAIAAIGWLVLGLQAKPLLVNKTGFSQAIYDRDGHLLRLTLSSDEKYRLWVPLVEIPPAMIDATLLQEDAWFRWHPGVNAASLLRAFYATYLHGNRRVGGSTITMQLALLRFGIDSRTLHGKIQQIGRAIQLERFYSKDEILEAYLNIAPYGGNIEGVGAASLVYFRKSSKHLSLAEALTLAVIPQSPSLRNPLRRAGHEPLDRARLRIDALWASTHPSDVITASAIMALRSASRSELPSSNAVATSGSTMPR